MLPRFCLTPYPPTDSVEMAETVAVAVAVALAVAVAQAKAKAKAQAQARATLAVKQLAQP